MSFNVSDKVVCVDDGPWKGHGPLFGTSVPLVSERIYVIRSIRYDGGVRLIGVILPLDEFGDEHVLWETRFRKLADIQAESRAWIGDERISMSDELDTMDDAHLSEVFAVEVAEIWRVETPRHGGVRAYSVVRTGAWREIQASAFLPDDLPEFATDANAVLPWLEMRAEVSNVFEDGEWFVGIEEKPARPGSFVSGKARTFARAACIALIRAKRAQPS